MTLFNVISESLRWISCFCGFWFLNDGWNWTFNSLQWKGSQHSTYNQSCRLLLLVVHSQEWARLGNVRFDFVIRITCLSSLISDLIPFLWICTHYCSQYILSLLIERQQSQLTCFRAKYCDYGCLETVSVYIKIYWTNLKNENHFLFILSRTNSFFFFAIFKNSLIAPQDSWFLM